MRHEIARLVYPVIEHALDLRERLQREEAVSVADEQMMLRDLLLPGAPEEPDDALERPPDEPIPADYLGGDVDENGKPGFLGILYGLTCWLDETFIAQEATRVEWSRLPLEGALYGSNDRDWRFWQQAHLAEKLPRPDALEAFYLCVMLGFRGGYRDNADKLAAWTAGAGRRLDQALPAWKAPAALEPVVFVPPLLGGDAIRRLLFTGSALLLGVIPLAAFMIARQLTP